MRSTLVALLLGSLQAVTSTPLEKRWGYGPQNVVYFLDNAADGSENYIVSMQIDGNGVPCNPIKTATGGCGMDGNANATGQPNGANPLESQGSVVVYGNRLFTVNSHSNTVSMFRINPWDPQHPVLVGQPASTGGEFPTSVDYSPKLNKVCALSAGQVAGVTCFSVDDYWGLRQLAPIRRFDSSIIQETTPPNGPPGTASQIGFTPDARALIVTIKGNTKNLPGSVLSYGIDGYGNIARKPTVNTYKDIVLPFGFNFVNNNEFFLVDPSFGVSLMQVNQDLTVTELIHQPIPGQVAICWSAIDLRLNTLYAVDAGINSIWTVNDPQLAQTGTIGITQPGAGKGAFDTVLGGNGYLYALAGDAGILVFDAAQRKQVDYVDLSSVAPRTNLIGMAYWPSSW